MTSVMATDALWSRPASPNASSATGHVHGDNFFTPSTDRRDRLERASMASPAPEKPRDMSQISWICLVISIISSMFLFALDNTIVADIQPSIIETLGEVENLPWISVGYALGAVALNLLMYSFSPPARKFWGSNPSSSNLFSKFDNKILFIAGVVLFETGSVVCGTAQSMAALIVGRVICGLGGVGIFVGGMNLLSVLTTVAERPMYLNIVGLAWGFGTIFGPIIGGAFTISSATWRWCFYINLCVGAVIAPVYLFVLPSHNPRPNTLIITRMLEIDWVGAILNAGAVIALIMGASFGGGLYAWSSSQCIGLFVCSGVLWILFIIQQALALFTTKQNRLFPVEYIRSREMNILFAQTASAVSVVYIPLYFVPLYFQFAKADSAFEAAIRLLPLVSLQVAGTLLCGALMNRVGYYVPWYIAGGILCLIGGALLHTVKLNTPTSAIYGYSTLVGLGSGLYVQAGYPIAQLKVNSASIPRVVAFIGYGQIAGITLALTISNSVFLNEATNKIAKLLPAVPKAVVQQAITGTRTASFQDIGSADRMLVLEAIVQSIGNVYSMVIAAGGLTTVLSLFMGFEKLPGSSSMTFDSQNEGTSVEEAKFSPNTPEENK